MNALYQLSKRRFRNEISHSQFIKLRREILETQFLYDMHLNPQPQVATQPQEEISPSKKPKPSNSKKEQHVPSAKASQNAENGNISELINNKKYILIAAAVFVVVVVVSISMIGGDGPVEQPNQVVDVNNEQTDPAALDLPEQFDNIVVKNNFSEESLDLFLGFWLLTDKFAQDEFMDDLDSQIFEAEEDLSVKLTLAKDYIDSETNTTIRQVNTILNGSVSNQSFQLLSDIWEKSDAREQGVAIDYMIAAGIKYEQNFDTQNEAQLIDEILGHLGLEDLIRQPADEFADSETSQNVNQPSVDQNNESESRDTASVSEEATIASKDIAPTEPEIPEKTDNVDKQAPASPVTTPLAETIASQERKQVAAVDQTGSVSNPSPSDSIDLSNEDELIRVYSEKIDIQLSKESLRAPADMKEFSTEFRTFFELLKAKYRAEGRENPNPLALDKLRSIYKAHPNYRFHYSDMFEYHTELQTNSTDRQLSEEVKDVWKIFQKGIKAPRN